MTFKDRSNTQGFTLVELLVSLAILAMVSAAVLSGLRTGLLVWNKGTDHVEDLHRSRVAVELLRDSISGALPFMYVVRSGETSSRKLAFEASPDHLRFVSRISFKDGPGSIPRWIDIRWLQDPGRKLGLLAVDERIILPPDNVPDAAPYWSGNLLQADSCSFDFLDGNAGEKPVEWIRDWQPSAEHLPKAIRVRCVAQSKEVVVVNLLDYATSYTDGMRLN